MTGPQADAAHLLRASPPMVVLRPGDRVLVTIADDPDPKVIADIASSLRKSFPGVDFTVLTGVASIAVSPGEA